MTPPQLPDRIRDAILSTPRPRCAYIYDSATLAGTAARVRRALPPDSHLLYAVKANSHPGVLEALARHVDGFEVASGGELDLVRALGGRIVFGGPAKTEAELAQAATLGATVNVESPLELHRLSTVADREVPITLRVNRTVRLPGSHRMTGEPTPFGIDEAQLPQVAALARALPNLRLIGFHLHAVSNNLDAAAHADFAAESVRWATAEGRRWAVPVEEVNLGGGFGIDYAGDRSFDLDVLAAGLVRAAGGPRLVFELGRFLAADAGWYAAEVLDLKRTHGRWFAVLRGGTHHFRLPAAWGYSHPFTVIPVDDWPHPYPRPAVRDALVDAVGELCTPRDVLSREVAVAELRVGDVLAFARTGAYGWDISHDRFLRHPPPAFISL